MRSKRAQLTSPPRGDLSIGLEIGVDPPDHRAKLLLRRALLISEGVEPMQEALGMHPVQGVGADIELACVVADDDGIAQQAMRCDAAHGAPSVATRAGPRLLSMAGAQQPHRMTL